MKTLIISGSPRKNGDSMTLVNEIMQKKKNGVLVISAGGDTRDYERSSRTANIIFNQMNTTSIGSVSTIHTNDIPAKEDIDALDKAQELALKLNELHKLSLNYHGG